jgi:hypothetical protein
MRRVYSANILSGDQEIVKDLLEDAKIPCMVRNEHLSMALGELAPSECSPELWIQNDADFFRAMEIVEQWRTSTAENDGPWVCRCGETIEGQFTSCWKCGSDKPVRP